MEIRKQLKEAGNQYFAIGISFPKLKEWVPKLQEAIKNGADSLASFITNQREVLQKALDDIFSSELYSNEEAKKAQAEILQALSLLKGAEEKYLPTLQTINKYKEDRAFIEEQVNEILGIGTNSVNELIDSTEEESKSTAKAIAIKKKFLAVILQNISALKGINIEMPMARNSNNRCIHRLSNWLKPGPVLHKRPMLPEYRYRTSRN